MQENVLHDKEGIEDRSIACDNMQQTLVWSQAGSRSGSCLDKDVEDLGV